MATSRKRSHDDSEPVLSISHNHHVAIIEMFNGGSHRQLVDLLRTLIPSSSLLTLPDKKWHWRARCGALQLLPQLLDLPPTSTLFLTAVGSLPEVLALCPSLQSARKVLYFHENQLAYPTQSEQNRDFQYGYNQVLSTLAADMVLFNSRYNLESFIDRVDAFLNKMPDCKPKGIAEKIKKKSEVLYFPVEFPLKLSRDVSRDNSYSKLHIVWPHRWEHDKNPDDLFASLQSLVDSGLKFKVSVLGKTYKDVPEVFEKFRSTNSTLIAQWGPLDTREEYLAHLQTCHVVVSTALHEFYGVAMLEGVWAGCLPLCPNRLSYPEIYPRECLFNTPAQLTKQLRQLCKNPEIARRRWEGVVEKMDIQQYSWERLKSRYADMLGLGNL